MSRFRCRRDAGNYITKLPKAEHAAPEWQAAMEALILVAELNGPTMFARIGVMLALQHSNPAPKIAPRGSSISSTRGVPPSSCRRAARKAR